MIAFQSTGPLLSFTGASTAPTSVQAISLNDEQSQQYLLTNIDGAVDCVVGWGQTDADAKLNAAAASNVANCTYLLHGTQVVITAAAAAFFSGITASSTAVVKVQAGRGN